MKRRLVQRGRQAQRFVGLKVSLRFDAGEPRPANRQRPRLVEHHRPGSRERFERPAVLDQQATARRPRYACDDGYGCSEYQRTGGGDDKHGQGPHRAARDQPCHAGHQNGERYEPQGVTVGEPGKGRLALLSLGDQPDNARVG